MITRTPMIDDDGSGTTGTILNNAWKQELYDQIDAIAAGPTITNTDTGTLNDWIPAGLDGRSTVILWRGTAAATITGIGVSGHDGQTITIKNRSAAGAVLSFPYFSASSAAPNRIVPAATSAPTPVAYEGWITLVWLAGVQAWVMVGHEQGQWITAPYNAADYSTDVGAAWTVEAGDVYQARYHLRARTLSWSLVLIDTVLATPANPRRKIFGGFTIQAGMFSPGFLRWEESAGPTGAAIGFCTMTPPDEIAFLKANYAATFAAGAVRIDAAGVCEIV